MPSDPTGSIIQKFPPRSGGFRAPSPPTSSGSPWIFQRRWISNESLQQQTIYQGKKKPAEGELWVEAGGWVPHLVSSSFPVLLPPKSAPGIPKSGLKGSSQIRDLPQWVLSALSPTQRKRGLQSPPLAVPSGSSFSRLLAQPPPCPGEIRAGHSHHARKAAPTSP